LKRLWNKYKRTIIVTLITIVGGPLLYLFGAKLINGNSSDKTIINHGNLSTDQKDGTVEQNYYAGNIPRNLTAEDNQRLENEIPKTYSVKVYYTQDDKESKAFQQQVIDKLKSIGIIPEIQPVGSMGISVNDTSTRFKIVPYPAAKTVQLYIMKQ
jgi:hypothetical protein